MARRKDRKDRRRRRGVHSWTDTEIAEIRKEKDLSARRGSVADNIQHALLSLRDWQRHPTADGRMPTQIIVEERRGILARKRQIIAGLLHSAPADK